MPIPLPAPASTRPDTGGGDPSDRAACRLRARADRLSADGRLDLRLDSHRPELRAHCRRMLGSSFEADDAVQETLVRAWRAMDRFDGRASLRTWLYRIATNVCLTMLQAPQRRARPLGVPTDEQAGASVDRGPADVVAERDAVRRAFAVALSRLPPRQRTVLVLRDVLGWRAADVAELLGATVASTNSALQRARSTLGAGIDPEHDRLGPAGRPHHGLLSRCVVAVERCDADALATLLRHDDGHGAAARVVGLASSPRDRGDCGPPRASAGTTSTSTSPSSMWMTS